MSLVNVKINRDTGDYETFREWDIVDEDELEDESFQILKENAKDKDDNGKVSKKIDNIDLRLLQAQKNFLKEKALILNNLSGFLNELNPKKNIKELHLMLLNIKSKIELLAS